MQGAEVLTPLTHAQRQAFKRMALRPDEVLGLGQMKCLTDTADALVAAGLAERVDGGWRCTVHGQVLKDVLTWFQLYHVRDRCSKRLGIVKARNTQSPAFPGEY
jgi:hypothetical protein